MMEEIAPGRAARYFPNIHWVADCAWRLDREAEAAAAVAEAERQVAEAEEAARKEEAAKQREAARLEALRVAEEARQAVCPLTSLPMTLAISYVKSTCMLGSWQIHSRRILG